jgi:hypothetical protein
VAVLVLHPLVEVVELVELLLDIQDKEILADLELLVLMWAVEAVEQVVLELLDLPMDTVVLVFKFQQHLEILNLYCNQVLAELLIG